MHVIHVRRLSLLGTYLQAALAVTSFTKLCWLDGFHVVNINISVLVIGLIIMHTRFFCGYQLTIFYYIALLLDCHYDVEQKRKE